MFIPAIRAGSSSYKDAMGAPSPPPPELGKKEGKNVKRREKSEEMVNKGKICKLVTYL